MKKTSIILLLTLCCHLLSAQSFNVSRGAQGSTLGIVDCFAHESSCGEEFDAEILLFLNTDSNGHETSWQVEDITEGSIIGSGDKLVSDTTYQNLICAYADHCYRFTIFDSEGNGIDTSQNRGYFIYWNGNLKNNGGNFGTNDSTSFGACCEDFSVELMGGIQCFNESEARVWLEVSGGTPAYEYLWSNGATFTETAVIASSESEISVRVFDAGNCEASDTLPIASLNSLAYDLETSTEGICSSFSGEASVTVLSGIPPFTYSWSSGGNKQIEQDLEPGNYSLTVTDASNCQVQSDVIIVDPSPIIIAVDSVISATPGNNNGAIFITVSGGSGQGYSYAWNDESNTIISEVEDPAGLSPGTFTVTVTDLLGCTTTNTIVATSIDKIALDQEIDKLISLLPNPTDGRVLLSLDFNLYHEVQIAMYDSQGKQLLVIPQKTIQSELFEWDLSDRPVGMYFFKISVDGRIVTKKLVYAH